VLIQGAVQERMADEPRVPQARERVFAVDVVRASAGTETPVLTAFGEVQSRRTLELRAATGGRVISLSDSFVEGGHVSEGAVLVRIDPADAQAAVDRARADLMDAEAEARAAERALGLAQDELAAAREQAELRARALSRQRDLAERGVGTAATVEAAELAAASARQAVVARRQAVAQAEARVDQAETRIARSEIALDEARRRLADTVLRADFDGTLADVAAIEGGLVSANERLARLIDPDALEVALRVSTPQYARLLDDAGALRQAPVEVRLDVFGADLTATGRLSRDSAAVGQGQTGRLLFARLEGARGFKPGDFVTVRIEEPPLREVVRLPATALDAGGTVLVLGEEDRLETMPVTLLRRQGDDVLVRAPGLEGRQVVAARTPLLGPGVKVRPVESGQAAAPAPEPMLELSEERRARLVAFIRDNREMPEAAKARILARLAEPEVPVRIVERIESRMGG
jgi:RND family efflux transporter MFP subunit